MQRLYGSLLPDHSSKRFQVGRTPKSNGTEIRSAACLLGCDLMRYGDGRAHRPPFLQCPGEARSPPTLGKRDDQDASIKLGPDPLTSHRTRQPKLARKTTIAPLQAIVIALLPLCSRAPLTSDMQKISFNLDADILTLYPWKLYLNNDLLRGFPHIDVRLPRVRLRGALPSPGLMDEFLKQPMDLLLHWEKWPEWQLFPHTVLLYTSAETQRCTT